MSDNALRILQTAKKLEGLLDRVKKPQAWVNRVGVGMLLNIQRERWDTKNTSEGRKWVGYKNKNYARWKLRKYADYPGGGRKMLVATSALVKSMTERGAPHQWKLVSDKRFELGTKLPYAAVQNQTRNFTKLSGRSANKIAQAYGRYLLGIK